MTAAFLVQQLQGEQTEQGAGGGHHPRAGIARLDNELVKLYPGQQREKQENTGHAGA
jgi:hypothetical protein